MKPSFDDWLIQHRLIPDKFKEIVDSVRSEYSKQRLALVGIRAPSSLKPADRTACEKAAVHIVEQKASVSEWVSAQFADHGGDTLLIHLGSDRALANYKKAESVQKTRIRDEVILQLRMFGHRILNDTIDNILKDTSAGYSPLFLYCMARMYDITPSDDVAREANRLLDRQYYREVYSSIFKAVPL